MINFLTIDKTTKSIDVFNNINDFVLKHGMTLDMCGALSTNKASVLGKKSRLIQIREH